MNQEDLNAWRKKLVPVPLSYFVDNLRDGKPFSFARYGDGEWLTLLGYYGGHNSNGCTFTRHLSELMRDVLRKKNDYRHAMLRISYSGSRGRKTLIPQIVNLLEQLQATDIVWYKGDTLLDQSLKGNLFPFVEQMREKRVLYVGPGHCRRLNENFFDYAAYIQPPPRDAINVRDTLIPDVVRAVQRHDIEVIGWSSGLHAKVFIDDIFERFSGEITQIDFGSMWDGYFQSRRNGSRTYIRRGNILFQQLLAVNTGARKRKPGETFRRDGK